MCTFRGVSGEFRLGYGDMAKRDISGTTLDAPVIESATLSKAAFGQRSSVFSLSGINLANGMRFACSQEVKVNKSVRKVHKSDAQG